MLCHRSDDCIQAGKLFSSDGQSLKVVYSLPLLQNLKTVTQRRSLHAARAALAIAGTLVTAAALLLPFLAAGESHVQMGAPGAALRATAHLNFKIIIPKVLYLNAGGGNDRVAGVQTVAIMSNSRNVTLAATVHTSDDDRSAAAAKQPQSDDEIRGNVILSAAAHRVIAQDAACRLGLAPPASNFADSHGSAAHDTRRVVCTASMP